MNTLKTLLSILVILAPAAMVHSADAAPSTPTAWVFDKDGDMQGWSAEGFTKIVVSKARPIFRHVDHVAGMDDSRVPEAVLAKTGLFGMASSTFRQRTKGTNGIICSI